MRVCRPCLGVALAALCLQPALALAQPVYRCASTYSDLPCAGGASIDVDDRRSAAQKAQTDAATVQAKRQARQMEAARLQGERPIIIKSIKPGKTAARQGARATKTKGTKRRGSGKSHKQAGKPTSARTENTATERPEAPAYFTATSRQGENPAGATPHD